MIFIFQHSSQLSIEAYENVFVGIGRFGYTNPSLSNIVQVEYTQEKNNVKSTW